MGEQSIALYPDAERRRSLSTRREHEAIDREVGDPCRREDRTPGRRGVVATPPRSSGRIRARARDHAPSSAITHARESRRESIVDEYVATRVRVAPDQIGGCAAEHDVAAARGDTDTVGQCVRER